MRVFQCIACVFATALLSAPLAALAVPRYAIQDLGTLGGTYSYAHGINDLGQVVGNADSATGRHACVWQSGTVTDLDANGQSSVANSINNLGQVVGNRIVGSSSHAYLWQGGTATDLGVLAGTGSGASGINDKGQIVGGSQTTGPFGHAFLYESNHMYDLGAVDQLYSTACQTNEKGEIAGTLGVESPCQAYLYRSGAWLNLQTLPGASSSSRDLNEKSQVVGEYRDSSDVVHAFIWENGSMRLLASSGIQWSYAFGINDTSQIVGNAWYTAGGRWHGAMWDGANTYDLDDLITERGWQIDNASDVNNRGQIVGSAYHNGAYHAFLMTPVPEPSSAFALLAGILGIPLVVRMRRKEASQP